MEATLADCVTKVESVFTSEAVKLWQVKARSLLTSFPPGTLLEILDSEFRVSDCFLPARVQLWIHSFRVLGGLGKETPPIKGIEASLNLQDLLRLYGSSRETRRVNDDESVTMSSPLHSQESCCSLNGNLDYIQESENDETKAVSQPFYTQISQTPLPKHSRQPLTSKQPRVLPDTRSNPRTNSPGISPVTVLKKGSPLPTNPAQSLTDTTESGPIKTSVEFDSHKDAAQEVILNRVRMDQAKRSDSRPGSTPTSNDHWPGGRTKLSNGRYLPRYLTKLCKDQEDILGTTDAWQPSKADRQIQGSVPNHVLSHFTELADKAAKLATIGSDIGPMEPPVIEELNEDVNPVHANDKVVSDAASECSSSSQSTEASWPPTPSQAPPALPDNSSPLRAPERRLIPPLSQNGTPVANTGKGSSSSQQEQSIENEMPVRTPERSICKQGEDLEAVGTTQYAQILSDMVDDEPDEEASGVNRTNREPMPLVVPKLPAASTQVSDNDFERPEASSSQLNTAEGSQRTNSVLAAPQTQKELSYQKGDLKALIQVQRTPFLNQPSSITRMPALRGQQASGPLSADDQRPHNDPEQKSSPSVVLCTFMHARNLGASEALQARLNHGKAEPSSVELKKDEKKGGVIHLLESGEAKDASSEGHASPASEAPSGPHQTSVRRLFSKRKRYGGEVLESDTRLFQSSEERHSCSSPVLSKKPRIVSNFPSLEALKDLSASTSAQIARESRRAFFRNQERAASNSSPLPTSTPQHQQSRRDKICGIQRVTSYETSPLPQPPTSESRPGLGSPTHIGSTKDCDVDRSSRLSLRRQSIYNEYKATYPQYQGSTLQFHKACKQIKSLYEKGRAPHPSLWDDFIFRRHHDYREYLLEIAEACEDALPYAQYYTEHVEKPSRMELVVTKSYILLLEPDSTLGSSVKSQSLTAPADIDTIMNAKESVAASSSASNILPARRTALRHYVSSPLKPRKVARTVDSYAHRDLEQSQESSVKQWVEQQSIAKLSGAESPELGSTDRRGEEDDVPQQGLDDVTEIPPSSPPCCQPARSEQNEAGSVWCDDPHTPFKNFAKSYSALASEKRHLKEGVQVDEKGCLKPHVQRVIEIFSLCKG